MRDHDELDMLEAAVQRFAEDHSAQAEDAAVLWDGLLALGVPGLTLEGKPGADDAEAVSFGAPGAIRLARSLGRQGIALDTGVALVMVPELLAEAGAWEALAALREGEARIALPASALPGLCGTARDDLAIGPPQPTHLLYPEGGVVALASEATRPVRLVDGQVALSVPLRERPCRVQAGRALSLGLIAAAAADLGAMETLFAATREHLLLRKQFGHPLASFQTLQFRLVDLTILIAESEALIAAAAREDPASDRGAVLAEACWIRAAEAARKCASEAIQLHGAIGMTAECGIARFVRRILTSEQLWGAPEGHYAAFRRKEPLFA